MRNIKLVETSCELEQLFALRHRVLAEEMGYSGERDDRRLFDRFDAYPGAANVVALIDGSVVAGLRVVDAENQSGPADDYFNFEPYLHAAGAKRVGSVGMFAAEPGVRKDALITSLIGMAHVWAFERGLDHLVAPLAPMAEAQAVRAGYQALAPRFYDQRLALHITPMMLDMARMSAPLAEFVARHFAEGRRYEHFTGTL